MDIFGLNLPEDHSRDAIRQSYIEDEGKALAFVLGEAQASFPAEGRARVKDRATRLVAKARAMPAGSGLIEPFLQEYGLSNKEGVALMRLAEALLRTPDPATADSLIQDKLLTADWADHAGDSPALVVNLSTRGLMTTAALLEEQQGEGLVDATRRLIKRLGQPVVRSAIGQAMRILGNHFVLGRTIEEALKRSQKLAKKGYRFSFDMLGEAAHTEADARRYFNDYARAIAALAAQESSDDVAGNLGISVKLSALHSRYEFAKRDRVMDELLGRVRNLAFMAREARLGFTIDAEEADRLEPSLDLIEALIADPGLKGWDGMGVVVQAYQKRAPFVIDWLAAKSREHGRKLMIRLVKGAYWDAEIKRAQQMGLEDYPVYTRKVSTDVSYLACAKRLLGHQDVLYPQFATHNAQTISAIMELTGNADRFEFQRLQGMGDIIHDTILADHKIPSRIYAPVGNHRDLLPYLVRRLLENGANSSFVNQLFNPAVSIDDVVEDPIDEAEALDQAANPHIGLPRAQFGAERLLAKGFDLTNPDTVKSLYQAVKASAAPLKAGPIIGGVMHLEGEGQPVRNPARLKHVVGEVIEAQAKDAQDALARAERAAPEWAATPAEERAACLRKAADLLEARKPAFMRIAVEEAGKSLLDADAEVREAIDFCRYYAARATDPETAARDALGVVLCISPWNFPLAIFLGQVAAALATGNAVIAKPAEQTPLIACEAVKLLHEAGVPGDALHYLPGDGARLGPLLTSAPAIKGICFTGSTETAQIINRSVMGAGKADTVLIAETGGINAMLVDSTALLEQAVQDIITSAFQSAGQRCSALRLLCVQEDIADNLAEMLKGAMQELVIGDPGLLKTDVGPVIDQEAYENIAGHISEMENSAKLLARAPETPMMKEGTFIAPTAFEISKIGDLKREVFGPVLHMARFKAADFEATVKAVNALGFGLTMGMHSRIDARMNWLAGHAHIGNLYVNRNQIGAVVGVQPFGGEGLSGTGPKAGGPHYLLRLSKPKTATAEAKTRLALNEAAFPEKLSGQADRARAALPKWEDARQRATTLDKAAAALRTDQPALSDALAAAARRAETHYAEPVTLPGPTGELNRLSLAPRGLILALGDGSGDLDALAEQTALALAAGNGVIAAVPSDQQAVMRALSQALRQAGAPDGVLQTFDIEDGALPRALLSELAVDAVAYDGGGQVDILQTLAARSGALLPMLSRGDLPYRYAAERTLTVNTTAAGGNVALLALGDD